MNSLIAEAPINVSTNKLVKELYETYAKKLLAYTTRNYAISIDDAGSLVYKTIYKIATVYHNYVFDNTHRLSAFIFKTHINYIKNYFRDNKNFESRNFEVELDDFPAGEEATLQNESLQLSILKKHLDRMEDWQRILLLMRGQDMPYNEIARFVNKPEKQLKVYYGRLKKELLNSVNAELDKLKGSNGK
jgi:RNA polymerase sigma factor (sigma-70 family)